MDKGRVPMAVLPSRERVGRTLFGDDVWRFRRDMVFRLPRRRRRRRESIVYNGGEC